ncbi:MAG: DUF883 family protein [Burkholderiaceae bacterium]
MNDMDMLREDRRRLAEDLKLVVRDAENILRHKVAEAEEGYEEARSRLERSIDSARGELRKIERSLIENSREALDSTEQYMRRHPWESVGAGVGIGLLLGALFARR